jgi:anaerobic selenocysteine-containing dehydrogenase
MFCPLDCWDACNLELEEKFKGVSPTPFLCWKLNNYFNFPREVSAKFNGKNIMLNKSLEKLKKILKNTNPKKILFIKGSGNMGIMQNVTKLFFENYGATFAIGSTCDGIGEEGIKRGRGKSLILPTWVIKNAKRVLIWGRNPAVTNIHLLPLIKGKEKIVIDARESESAKIADKFIKVGVNRDFYLALYLAKRVIESGDYRRDGEDFKRFKEIVFAYSKDELLKKAKVKREDAEFLFDFIKKGAVVLTGLGVAKCKECWKTTWAIDSLFYMLDYFGKIDKGVAFLGSSGYGLNNPFSFEHKNQVPLFDVNLDEFDVVFIQGANPLLSFAGGEWEKLKEKTTIVFGKYMDETAQIATLFIPTKDFYCKKDIRGSYFNEYVMINRESKECEGISEYELTKYLMNEFGFGELRSEDDYIDEILGNGVEEVRESLYIKKVFKKPPYSDGFFTGDKKFHFLSEDFRREEKEFEIITAKHKNALNSQFLRDERVFVNPNSKEKFIEWAKENFNQIEFDETTQENVLFTKGRGINKLLEVKGSNAYYEL